MNNIKEFWMKNKDLEVSFINIGGAITSINLPDRDGVVENVVLAHQDYNRYLEAAPSYLGAVVGRTAGRIPGGRIEVEGNNYTLSINDKENTLHGGRSCFSTKAWQVKKLSDTSYTLFYVSEDGEEGFPAQVTILLTYTLEKNRLIIDYHGTTTKMTPLNLTNHSYFNLSGCKGLSLDHALYLDSTRYLEVDENLLATGKVIESKGSGFDFFKKKLLGFNMPEEGYDYCNLLEETRDIKKPAASLFHEKSARRLNLYTDQPAIVLYNDVMADGKMLKSGEHKKFLGICLETQKPNMGLNQEYFSTYLIDETTPYSQKTIYEFLVEN